MNESLSDDQIVSLIETYYRSFIPTHTISSIEDKNEKYQIANRIFMQSMYLIPILHYGRILGTPFLDLFGKNFRGTKSYDCQYGHIQLFHPNDEPQVAKDFTDSLFVYITLQSFNTSQIT